MHQPAMSTSTSGSGSDMGIRETWMPLFYKYGVDLVLAGHDHDYERSFAVRGVDMNDPDAAPTLRPTVVSFDTTEVDTSEGLVHVVLGGGGTSSHDDIYFGTDSAFGPYTPANGLLSQVYNAPTTYKAVAQTTELATWSAVRDPNTTYPWGIGVFDVDPGRPHRLDVRGEMPGQGQRIVLDLVHAALHGEGVGRVLLGVCGQHVRLVTAQVRGVEVTPQRGRHVQVPDLMLGPVPHDPDEPGLRLAVLVRSEDDAHGQLPR